MASISSDKKVISKKNEGFPEWLDFEKLRREGIDYIAELSGNIWTDHNLHDPGITILETLCYALLDLGYRTSLPIKDLFSKNPDDNQPEDNFYTPAQILGNNPLTITDFRKLLVDIPYVRNAWLIPAEDITINNICGTVEDPALLFLANGTAKKKDCIDFLNGLYHVYLDLDNDEQAQELSPKIKEETLGLVKEMLMKHRNLCEDFYDFTILCKQKIGFCADIEIEATANLQEVFIEIIKRVREFLSPTPKFYRLKQLLDKGRSIEDIYAGRPIDLEKSHGFLDLEEFEKIPLRKEIHISDVYDVIFQVPGVSGIRNLRLLNCNGAICFDKKVSDWVFPIFENHIPEFSMDCSGFHFIQNGLDLNFDKKKYEQQLKLNFYNSGKSNLLSQYPDLDIAIPTGNYRKDLDAYFPLENEFPKVYGLAEGALPESATNTRKAQALQMKGYLLFFDHLLSGYLSQLKNIRQLFSFSSPSNEKKHTYFVNQLTDWPGLEQLLSYATDTAKVGPSSSSMAFPVDRKQLGLLLGNNIIPDCDFEQKLVPYLFCSADARDIAIHQLILDTQSDKARVELVKTRNDCWFFIIYSSSDKFGIVGTGEYKTEATAMAAAESLLILASERVNYKGYRNTETSQFSFDIRQNQSGYWQYLQQLTETDNNYQERRSRFLKHLLSRFAETFTDYTLLSYSLSEETVLNEKNILKTEKFLQKYPQLSSGRGKGFNYQLNGWNNDNLSGLETRIAAYAGMDNVRQQNLCHYEVVKYEEQSVIKLGSDSFQLFKSDYTFDSRQEAREILQEVLARLKDKSSYKPVYNKSAAKYELMVSNGITDFIYTKQFDDNQIAADAAISIQRLFVPTSLPDEIIPSQYRHTVKLVKRTGSQIWTRKQPIVDEQAAFSVSEQLIADFSNEKIWLNEDKSISRTSIELKTHPDKKSSLINLSAFEPSTNPIDVRNKEIIYQFTVHDPQKNFFFISVREYQDKLIAEAELIRLLFLLSEETNYKITQNERGENIISIYDAGQLIASNTIELTTLSEEKNAVQAIIQYVLDQFYDLNIDSIPVKWRFNIYLGLPLETQFKFISNKEYTSFEDAESESGFIAAKNSHYDISINKQGILEIKDEDHPRTVFANCTIPSSDSDSDDKRIQARNALQLKKSMIRASADPSSDEIEKMIVRDKLSLQGDYGYRLVKKDGFHAWYHIPENQSKESTKDQLIATYYKNFQNTNDYLDICYGGNIIIEKQDSISRKRMFYYRIQTLQQINGYPLDFILFESVKGYDTVEEAQNAFDKLYARILNLASDKKNYGTVIGFEERIQRDKYCADDNVELVYIPKETMKFFGYNKEYASIQLSNLSNSFPIRTIKKSDELFIKLFPCEEIPIKEDKPCNKKVEEKEYYYFRYLSDGSDESGWFSYEYFETTQETLYRFRFFLVLLQYKGNYHIGIDNCDCKVRLYLREILAVSKQRFASPEIAWGKAGVHRLICTSQQKDAFQAYQQWEDCHFKFVVGCGNTGLIHPCRYDSSDKRDLALEKLRNASKELSLKMNKDEYLSQIHSVSQKAVKWLKPSQQAGQKFSGPADIAKHIINVINEPLNLHSPIESELSKSKESAATIEEIDSFKKFAYYYPVVQRNLVESGKEITKYFIEIKLPGFCDDTMENPKPCGCGSDTAVDDCSCCCTAWVSECCFDSESEALDYYLHIVPCLSDSANYYPVFGCDCDNYGIRFYCNCEAEKHSKEFVNQPDPNEMQRTGKKAHCCNEIVAYNPQHYTNPSMVCDAIKRAKSLINAEGLHLVEHILLRPHCMEGDCKCIIQTCDIKTNCEFTWELPKGDPCTSKKCYCYVPGADPYSFLATVVLPAWPERFRTKGNRQIIEQLLYREVPSHIMLRILWLSPKDMCRYEGLYKNWTRWLAGKKICDNGDPACSLIDFLFKHTSNEQENPHTFDCFECDECTPCEETAETDTCAAFKEPPADPNLYVNEINRLFCWPVICDETKSVQTDPNYLFWKQGTALSKAEVLPEVSDQMKILPEVDIERVVDRRFYQYRDEVGKIANQSSNDSAALAHHFLMEAHPEFSKYHSLVEAIIANKKSGESKRLLNVDEKRQLIKFVTWYFLDTMVLGYCLSVKTAQLRKEVLRMKEKKCLPDIETWLGEELNIVAGPIAPIDVSKIFK